MLPVYLFAYANDINRPLKSLEEELDAISIGLDTLASPQKLIYKNDISTTPQLANALLKYQRVCAFHFAGHANGRQLLFEDQQAEIKGILPMLKLQKELFLVVLNGCSTEGQVDRLLQEGIPAVIATQRPVNDKWAKQFAERLWGALAEGQNLGKAFDFALTGPLNEPDLEMARGVDWTGLTRKQNQGSSEWVLRYQPENELTVKEWTLTQGNKPEESNDEPEEHALRYEVNDVLTNTLFDIVSLHRPEKLVNADGIRYTGNEQGQYLRDLQVSLYKALPYPIGVQIRQLFASDFPATPKPNCYTGVTRLKKLINAFDITTELLLYVLMAQLWRGLYERKQNKISFSFPDSCRQILHDYFNRSNKEFRKTDVMPIIRAIREVLDENRVEVFVEEISKLKDLIDNDLKFREAYGYLQWIKQVKIEKQLKPEYRQETENQFVYLLSKLGFMTRYYLLNIGNIRVNKRLYYPKRHKRYNHFLIALDYEQDEIGDWDGDQYNNDCFDDNSILLTKINYTIPRKTDESDPDLNLEYLNLSPFVIDQNALKHMEDVDVLFFESYDKEQRAFIYKQINNIDSEIFLSATGHNSEKKKVYEEQRAKPVWEMFNEFVNEFNHHGTGQPAP